jgi:hypothetical protein
MKLTRVILFSLAMLTPQLAVAQSTSNAQRAWRPFFSSLRAAVKQRNREALTKMMAPDFYYMSSGGDDNNNQDTRDEAFVFWDSSSTDVWKAFDRILAKGTVIKTAMPEVGTGAPGRISPPLANNPRAIRDRTFEWFAIFEFREGRWYCVAFAECCD